MPQIEERLVPEPGIEQVEHRVFGAADVEIDGHEALLLLRIAEGSVVVGIDEAQEVPARSRPLGHDVELAVAEGSPHRHLGPLPARPPEGRSNRGVGIIRGTGPEVLSFGEDHGQAGGHRVAVGMGGQGERLSPIALAREHPVTQAAGDRPSAHAGRFQGADHARFGLGRGQTRDRKGAAACGIAGPCAGRVDRPSVPRIGEGAGRLRGRLDDLDDRDPVLVGEGVVPVVVGGDGHDRSGAVVHAHIVGGEDRDALPVHGTAREDPREDPALLLVLPGRREGGLSRLGRVAGHGFLGRGGSRLPPPGARRVLRPGLRNLVALRQQGMLGRHDHEGGSEEGIGAGGEDLQAGAGAARGVEHVEADLGALAAADPVALHLLDRLRPVEGKGAAAAVGQGPRIEVLQEPLGEGGDAQHPLLQRPPVHRVVADLAATLGGDLLVGQDRAEAGTPVDGDLLLVGHAVVVQDRLALRLGQLLPPGLHGAPGASLQGPPVLVRDPPLSPLEGIHELGDRAGPPADGPPRVVAPRQLRVVPAVEELQEDPLGPAVVVLVGGGDLPVPVVAEAQVLQLGADAVDALIGGDGGMDIVLDGILLGG